MNPAPAWTGSYRNHFLDPDPNAVSHETQNVSFFHIRSRHSIFVTREQTTL